MAQAYDIIEQVAQEVAPAHRAIITLPPPRLIEKNLKLHNRKSESEPSAIRRPHKKVKAHGPAEQSLLIDGVDC
ncbi:hypothetical protein, partial [Pseudomonas urmiensis]|uniref:hypothetical protein n=1 Tax=Pseudomonas urmiensis TaxID=2745493 RepID=UPI0034D66CEE